MPILEDYFMSKLKDKISSVVFLWIGAGLAIIAMIMIGVPAIEVDGTKNSGQIFWDFVPTFKGVWPMFVGYMLVLVAGLLMAVIAIPTFQPSASVEKIVLIIAGAMLVLGIVLICLFKVVFVAINGWASGYSDVLSLYPGPFIAAGLAFLALGCDITALALDW